MEIWARKGCLVTSSLEVKYGCEWGGWCSSSIFGPYGVSLLKSIRRGGPLCLNLSCLKLEMDQKCSSS